MVKKYYTIWFAAVFLMTPFSANAEEKEEEAEAEATVSKKLPVGADFYLSNNVSASTVSKAYNQDPYVASQLYVYPNLKFGPFWGDREFKTHVEFNGNLEWFGKDNPFNGAIVNKFSLGDMKLRAELKNALSAKELGLSLTPAFKLEAPASKASRDSNRIIGLGGYLVLNWAKWGLFINYKPVFLSYAYSAPYKSADCAEDAAAGDRLSNGQCLAEGRQTMFLIKNGVFTGYTNGNHTITLGFRSYHSFLRAANQGEKAEKQASSGVLEATLGLVEYAYNLPVAVPTTLILGVSSYQAPYDAAKGFRTPFFNFAEPESNQTEGYLAVNVSI